MSKMNLTKGQKDALVRKVLSVIHNRRQEELQKLMEEWEPNEKVAEILEKAAKIQEALINLHTVVKEAGYNMEYSTVSCGKGSNKLNWHYSDENPENMVETWKNNIKENQVTDAINGRFPIKQDIVDDLELQCLDKAFDVDAFISKYSNL